MTMENPNFIDEIIEGLIGYRLGGFVYKKFVKEIEFKNNQRILEFGCGGGCLTKHVVKKLDNNSFVTSIDISDFWVNKAKKRLKKYEYINIITGNIYDLDIKEGSFDTVLIHYVLHDIHIADRENIIKTLKDKLKINGKIYIKEPTKETHGMPVSEIRQLMTSNNLEEVRFKNDNKKFLGVYKKNL